MTDPKGNRRARPSGQEDQIIFLARLEGANPSKARSIIGLG